MKRWLVVLLTMVLVVAVSGDVLAAMNFRASLVPDLSQATFMDTISMNVSRFDSWYSIKPETEYFKGYYYSTDGFSAFDLKYYKNDQTFVRYEDSDTASILMASYLFDFGFFAGVFNTDNSTLIYPGYRWNFGDNNYVALKYVYNTEEQEGLGFFINSKYYTDKMYLNGLVTIPESDGDPYYHFGVNYQASESVVVGFLFTDLNGVNAYELGCTVGNEDSILIFDASYGQDASETNYYILSGMYQIIDNLRIGVEYDQRDETDEDAIISLKAKYTMDDSQFGFKYYLENDDLDASFCITYLKNF